MIRKIKLFIATIAVMLPMGLATLPATAGAVDIFKPICGGTNDTQTNAQGTSVCNSGNIGGKNPIISVLKIAISIIALIIGVASVIVIVLAGLTMITSNGDAQAVAKARSSIIYALVGIVIAALAETIVAFVLNKI